MKALLIIDMQKDFMPGGALPTKEGNLLVPIINNLMKKFPLVVTSKDWHPKDHISFASNHPGKEIGDVIDVGDIKQVLWPIHCVQNSEGAQFVSGLDPIDEEHIFYKGVDPKIDSYSAFFDNAHLRSTGLEDFLKKNAVQEIVVVGVATDYCVLYSVLDALELGFSVMLVADGCHAINLHPDDEKKALEKMKKEGAKILQAEEVQ